MPAMVAVAPAPVVAPGLPISAPVLEFLCLFTRDLKRKQKRWQDGRLKFHTFNKRIMVHDDRGNFIGDAHWRADHDLDDGEELTLERGGVLVQVSECVGRRDQDLTELFDRRPKESQQQQASAAPRASTSIAGSRQRAHRSLHEVIASPAARLGRAIIPNKSPYEQRHGAGTAVRDNDPRPAKRRRREPSPPSKSGYAQSLFGATLSLSARPASTPPSSGQPLEERTNNSTHLERPRGSYDKAEAQPIPTSKSLDENHVIHPPLSQLVSPQQSTSARIPNANIRSTATNKAGPSMRDPLSNPSASSRDPRNTRPRIDMGEISDQYPITTERVTSQTAELVRVPGSRVNPRQHKEKRAPMAAEKEHSSSPGAKELQQNLSVTLAPSVAPPEAALPVTVDSPVDNLRAELRIKPRQKRGLLISGKSASTSLTTTRRDGRNQKAQLETDGSSSNTHREALTSVADAPRTVGLEARLDNPPSGRGPSAPHPETAHKSKKKGLPVETETSVLVAQGQPERNSEETTSLKLRGSSLSKTVEEHQRGLGSEGRIDQQRGKGRSEQQPNHNNARGPPAVGPRLASLGRKSIKSKEIIGYAPDDECVEWLASRRGTRPNSTEKQTESASASPTFIQNPATRGRKAATKSDAAGQVPQSVVPANPTTGSIGLRCEPTRLPGFSRAGGGPWTREAYDLLGMQRPRPG